MGVVKGTRSCQHITHVRSSLHYFKKIAAALVSYVQYVLTRIEEKRISMDNTNTSGEQNDRIQTYFLLATERSSFAMYGVRYI